MHDASYRFDPTYITKDYRYLNLRPTSRQDAYRADITYGTNNEFGFDYLRDNMKFALEEYVQRDLHFAVVDEVDNILIDEARTPLIISGPAEESTDKYYKLNRIIPKLQRGAVTQGDVRQEERDAIEAQGDYTIDEKAKTVSLTEGGVAKVERLLGVHNLYDPRHIDTLHHVNQALKAHNIFKRDVDYVIKDGEIIIVDEFTGRLMPGRRWSDGLHQAVEAKEGVHIREENQTLATITIQNYFRMYTKLAGMTGTADTEAPGVQEDLRPRRGGGAHAPAHGAAGPCGRGVPHRAREVRGGGGGDRGIQRQGPARAGGHRVGGEVGNCSPQMLKKKKVKHNVLNAVNHEAEASIIAQAGRLGAVTIATNMAGRGTDILLGRQPGVPGALRHGKRVDHPRRQAAAPGSATLRGRAAGAEGEVRSSRCGEADRDASSRRRPTYEQQRSEALRSFTEIQGRLMGLSPFRDLRQEYEERVLVRAHRRACTASAPSRNRTSRSRRISTPRCWPTRTTEKSGGPARASTRRARPSARFVERWQGADGQRQQLLEAVDDSRRLYEQRLEEYEFVVTRSVVAQERGRGAGEGFRGQPRRLRGGRGPLRGVADSRTSRKPGQFHEAYESKRLEYVQAVEEVREELEKAPEAYSHRYDEILAGYQDNSTTERDKVVAAGGLHIIGTERHESRRIDNQLRGRAGRQGDPGASRFFLSLEDDLMRIFGADRMQGIMNRLGMEEGVPIEHGMVSRAIENAQKKVEAHNFDIRKHLLEYDDVMNKQREVVYGQRRDALGGEKLKSDVLEMATQLAEDTVDRFVDKQAMASEWDIPGLVENLRGRLNLRLEFTPEELETRSTPRKSRRRSSNWSRTATRPRKSASAGI